MCKFKSEKTAFCRQSVTATSSGVCPSPAFQDGAKAADPPTVAEMVQEGGVTPQFSTETSCWMESCNL